MTSASRYVTSASRYQNRSSMCVRGLISRNWSRQFRLTNQYDLGSKVRVKGVALFKVICERVKYLGCDFFKQFS